MKKIIIGFLLFGFICSVFTTPVPDNTDDTNYQDDQDYDQQYDDQNESDESKNKVKIDNVDLKGTLELKEYFIKAKPGDKVEFDCLKYLETNIVKENLVVIWYNETIDTLMLSTGTYITADQNRFEIKKNQNLIIKSVNQYDTGKYKCEITGLVPDLEISVKLEVETPPKVEILANKRIVTGNIINYKEHARIELECIAGGVPKPAVRWSVNKNLLDGKNAVEMNDGNLVIKRASHHHAGDYQCLAENNLHQIDHGAVTIHISYAPRVKIHKTFVNSMEGSDRALHCLFHSNPDAKVVWEKNNHVLKSNEKYDIIQDNHHGENRSNLIVKNIDRSDLGVYQCKAQNIVGASMDNVSLTFTPEPAHFVNTTIEGRQALINWEIRSMLPLSEIILYYRKNGETPWAKETTVDHTHNQTYGIYYVSHKLQLEPGVWEALVKSKNREGESPLSDPELFTINSVIDFDLDENENAPGARGNGSRLQSSILAFVAFEIVRRLLHTYHQN